MKKNLMAKILFYFIPFSGVAQQPWAQSGATWYFTEGSITTAGYIKVQKTGEINVLGKLCDSYSAKAYYYDATIFNYDSSDVNTSITYIENNIVYALSGITGTFYKLYDFNALPGSSWYIHGTAPASQFLCLEDSTLILVDSVTTTIINSDTLKVIFVSQPGNASWTFGSSFTEKLGGNFYLFPQPFGCLAEVPVGLGLRCYQDSSGWNYQVPGTPPCNYIMGIQAQNFKNPISITPNPAGNVVYINYDSKENQKAEFTLFNSLSQAVKTINLLSSAETQSISTDNLPDGIYFWQLKSNDQNISNGKLVILK
jgi:hypothetical protein